MAGDLNDSLWVDKRQDPQRWCTYSIWAAECPDSLE